MQIYKSNDEFKQKQSLKQRLCGAGFEGRGRRERGGGCPRSAADERLDLRSTPLYGLRVVKAASPPRDGCGDLQQVVATSLSALLFKVTAQMHKTLPSTRRFIRRHGNPKPCSVLFHSLHSFRCGDGYCARADALCDGVRDCKDNSDEVDCFANKPKNQWQCRDGSCIGFDGVCDGARDCADGSDETHALCRKMKCQSNWFRCTYGACVDGTAPCNGVRECADGSDELQPRCFNETGEVGKQFKCEDGSTIESWNRCDGVADCADGSDETVAACAGMQCPSYVFQCAYGACVDQGSDCNGKMECADGSDEDDELCNRTGPAPPAPTAGPATPQYAASRNATKNKGVVSLLKKLLSVKEFFAVADPRPHQCVVEDLQIILRPSSGGPCKLPALPDHGNYVVLGRAGTRPGDAFDSFALNYTCDAGYGAIGKMSIYCHQGFWPEEPPRCVSVKEMSVMTTASLYLAYGCRFGLTNGLCRLAPHPSVEYACQVPGANGGTRPCERYEPVGTLVLPTCRTPNYYSPQILSPMKCIEGSWNYIANCIPGLTKNGTNVTILIKDQVEVYISGIQYTVTDGTKENITEKFTTQTVAKDNAVVKDFNAVDESDWRIGAGVASAASESGNIHIRAKRKNETIVFKN
ncbi:Modular serine protease [Eumeta japonica]|uniref:Modular serine protease n=1 Tax=Eumeta variegata TaxID=151549 RepID=A0A4C1VDE8_EUMVA|nr:Modular serine protease [Eumeta japonica]